MPARAGVRQSRFAPTKPSVVGLTLFLGYGLRQTAHARLHDGWEADVLRRCPSGRQTLQWLACVVTEAFVDLLSDRRGQAVMLAFAAVYLPLCLALCLDGLRPGRSWLTGRLLTLVILAAGQLYGLGFGLCIVGLPLQILSHNDPSTLPSRRHVHYAIATVLATTALWLLTTAWPLGHPYWLTANLAFQLYPLLFLPLFALPARLSAAEDAFTAVWTFRKVARLAAVLWYAAIALAAHTYVLAPRWPPFARVAAHFVGLDGLATALYAGARLALDHVAAYAPVRWATVARWALKGGPGFALAQYHAERVAVEARRLARSERLRERSSSM